MAAVQIEAMVWDEIEGQMVPWTFRVNPHHFIDVVIDGKVMDTLYAVGMVMDKADLILKVDLMLSIWKLSWEPVTS